MEPSIGMMEGAFFVSKTEIINWVNTLLVLKIKQIEQFASGNIYCQLIDILFPGKINMSKVNWKAKLEWEFVNNYKLLQQSFLKCNIKKYIEVEKIVKARSLDNLEFAQWMKRYFDLNEGLKKSETYDPIARRGGVEPDFSFVDKLKPAGSKKEKEKESDVLPRISKKEEELDKKEKLVKSTQKVDKKRSYSNKSPFDKSNYDSSVERKLQEKKEKNQELKEKLHERVRQDLEDENKYLKDTIKDIEIIVKEKGKGEEFYKEKIKKIETIINSMDEDKKP